MQWPVTAGTAIDFNVPQYWRAGTADDHKLLRLLSTPGLLELLERDTEALTDGADESLDGESAPRQRGGTPAGTEAARLHDRIPGVAR
jgi:hypothetical protein